MRVCNGVDYDLIEPEESREIFQDDNNGLLFGINWLDGEGEDVFVVDCEWFATAEERQEAIDRWYADENKFESEQ